MFNSLVCPCGIHRNDCDYHKPEPVTQKSNVYDVRGTCFISGVTNFTMENLFDALAVLYPNKDPSQIDLTVDTALFYLLKKNGLVDYAPGMLSNEARLQGMRLFHQPLPIEPSNCFTTFITTQSGENVGELKTREA